MDRRGFFEVAGTAVFGSVLWAACGGNTSSSSLAGNTIVIPEGTIVPEGELANFITPQSQFFRIDTAIGRTPQVKAAEWSLRIHGMVDNEVTLTLADLQALPQVENVITLGCVSNEVGGDLIGNARWGGVLFSDVLKSVGVQSGSTQLVSTSIDGWNCGTPVEAITDGRAAMLATSMNGETLTAIHGYPVRMIVPGLFGYVSATKWVTDLNFTTWDAFDPYWLKRGWAAEGPMLASSRIDLPRKKAEVKAGVVNVAGFAWAPRAGVASVEVRVDEGDWVKAEVLPGSTGDTWAQWTHQWQASAGGHRISTRVVSKDGTVQTAEVAPVEPSGATGYHAIDVTVV